MVMNFKKEHLIYFLVSLIDVVLTLLLYISWGHGSSLSAWFIFYPLLLNQNSIRFTFLFIVQT